MDECKHKWNKWSWQPTRYLKGELMATIWEARYCPLCERTEVRLAYKKKIDEEHFVPTRKHFRAYKVN